MPEVGISTEQTQAIEDAFDLLKHHQVVTIGGYAGTGKTSLIKHIIRKKPYSRVCAYTGKATDVLKKKGVQDATTIHRLIYKCIETNEGEYDWFLEEDLGTDLVIVDEASMVSKDLYTDLVSFGTKIIAIGDHGQLPPVGDDFNLMEDPMIRLETIHRNSGEITLFANHLRRGEAASRFKSKTGAVRIGKFDVLDPKIDQVICGFNSTRKRINASFRGKQKYEGTIKPGEPILILNNNQKHQVYNGMQGVVDSILRGPQILFTFRGKKYRIPVVLGEKHESAGSKNLVNWAFGYTLTCHKCQGDEWDTIGVIEEQCPYWEPHRWNYTAASRARKQIYWK